jgi:type II secretory pathway pseudopilin PulG
MVKRPPRGVAYLTLLFAVAATSATLAGASALWSQAQQREREAQLLWAGEQYRRAIVAYARHAADDANRYPATLQDLLLDPRSAAPRRFLRRLHDDPMSGSTDWALIRDARGRIVGVHSRSAREPLKRAGFGAGQRGFERARRYADWRFTAVAEPVPEPAEGGLVRPAQDAGERAGPNSP